MRIVKIILWILIAYILYSVFGGVIAVQGCVPELLLAFSVIFSFMERRDSVCAYIMLICGILSGSSVGRNFSIDVLVIGISSVAAHTLSSHAQFIPRFVRAEAVVLAAAALICGGQYFAVFKSVPVSMLPIRVIIDMVYTLICGSIMYPLIAKSLFRNEEKKFFTL